MPSEEETAVVSLMNSIASSSGEISKQISALLQRVRDGGIDTNSGISFLEVKYHQLLAYLINLTYVMCLKSKGTSINRDPAIDRLVEIRTVLERMRPIEHKLRYQIEKVVKAAASTSADGAADPLQYKPNPEDLVSKLDDEDEDEENGSEAGDKDDGDEGTSSATKLYRPPKLAAAHYDEDDVDLELKAKKASQKRAFGKNMMEELRREYYEGPEEVHDTFDHQHRAKEDKLEKETTEYEEKYFVRMPVSKKQKHAAQKVRTLSSLDDIVSFGGSHDREFGAKVSKQKRKGGKNFKSKKGGGGHKKRRKFH